MRAWFAGLVLLLLAVVAWAAWDDAFPSWRGYQRELHRRAIERLEAELTAARAELGHRDVQAELTRLDRELETVQADSTTAPLVEARERLREAQDDFDSIRAEIREAERRLQEPRVAEAREATVKRLDEAQEAYAAATGTWPPDTLRLARLWAVRDSIADELVAIEGPLAQLRALLEERRAAANELHDRVAWLSAPRDSLERKRRVILEPVASREGALARLRNRPLRVREISSPDGMEVARCPTCHGSLEDPPGAHPPLPATEVFRDVPCTACHGGHGRALDLEHAHRELLATVDWGAGPYSMRGRLERLARADAARREDLREELRRITGVDPAEERAGTGNGGDADSAVAAAWVKWWDTVAAYFEPSDSGAEDRDGSSLLDAGVDPWVFSARGRPLKYVGSRKCLSCHEALHREHSRRWMATKFRSLERLAGVADPRPCLPCHTTGWDEATGTYAEPGVTCEGCHGPGERYNEMMTVGQELVGMGDETRGRAILQHSARLSRESVSRRLVPQETGPNNVCVTCHHPRQHRAGCPGILDRNKPRFADGNG